MRAYLIVAITAVLGLSMAHAVEVYRWVDKDGKVHYSDLPPPPNARDPELRKLGKQAVDVDKLSYAARDAAKKNPVTLYATNCGEACDKARQLLSKRGIPFTSKNPESSKPDAEALKKLVGALEVPVLVVGTNSPLKGFEAAAWSAALDAAGYPTTAMITPKGAAKPEPAGAAKPDAAAEPKPEASEKPEEKPAAPKN
jgi:glutaredoxin